MSFACQMSSWRVALVSFPMLEILCENSQIASELCGNVEKQISPDLKCGLEYHMRGKQITCANVSFAHVICFPHMWNTANHMNACNPPDSVLPRVFCTWFVGDKSQSLIKKTFQFPWEIVIFFLSRVQRKVLHVGRFTVKEDPDFGLLLESVNGVAGSERERTYWEILSRRSGEYRRLDVGECPPQSFNTAYLRKP